MNTKRVLPVKVKFIKTHPDAKLPSQSSPGSSGFDIYATERTFIRPRSVSLINTGLRISLPEGYEAQIRPRSGLALKHGVMVVNSPGTIDADYRGSLGVLLTSIDEGHWVEPGDRIAQLVIKEVVPRVKMLFVDEFDDTERGEGGFGSTGA